MKTWERLRKKGDPAWYAAYRRSHHWRRLRKKTIERAGYRCQQCGAIDPNRDSRPGTRLHVHHRTYARLGEEHYEDLAVLCRTCHEAEHRPKMWRMFTKLAQGKLGKASKLGFGKIDTRTKISRVKGR